ARQKGLEPLAKIMMAQQTADLTSSAQRFITKEVPDVAHALSGAADIAAEWISENLRVRNALRRFISRESRAESKVIEAKKPDENAQKYQQYFDWSEPLQK